jgi:hypothetical protein
MISASSFSQRPLCRYRRREVSMGLRPRFTDNPKEAGAMAHDLGGVIWFSCAARSADALLWPSSYSSSPGNARRLPGALAAWNMSHVRAALAIPATTGSPTGLARTGALRTMFLDAERAARRGPCWSRAMACPNAARRASRYAVWNSGTLNQQRRVLAPMPATLAASSMLRWLTRNVLAQDTSGRTL